MFNKFQDETHLENHQNIRFLAESVRFDLNDNKDHYRDILQNRFGANISEFSFVDKNIETVPIYGADGAQITISPEHETYTEGVVSSVIIGGKTQDSKVFKPIEKYEFIPSFFDETGELVKITMRDSEYLAISSFFHEFSGNLMADGSSVQALYDIVKMVKSGLSFKSIANEEILENILVNTLCGKLVFLPKRRKSCNPNDSKECTSHIHQVLAEINPDIHVLHERQVLSPLMNANEIFYYPANGVSRYNQWSNSGFSNKKIISENASKKVASTFNSYADMIHSEYNGSFVKFGNNQHIQEIEYFCRDDFNFINILKSIEIEIRGNIPQPLPIYKADQIAKDNVRAQLVRINTDRDNKNSLKEFVLTRPIPLRS